MALTRDFKQTVLTRVQRDPKFRNALLKEGIKALLAGDVDSPAVRHWILKGTRGKRYAVKR
jgi:hypothetical protein